MRRNFGWTAIPATWTILLILSSGLASERASSNPCINNEHTSYEVRQGPALLASNRKVIDGSTLRYAKQNFMPSQSPTKALSLEFKNTANRDLRLTGDGKRTAMSNAMASSKHLRDSNDKNTRLAAKRATTANTRRLSRVIVVEKSRDAGNYRKFISSLRAISPPISRELKGVSGMKERKKRAIYAFSSDRKTAIRRDSPTFGGKGQARERKRAFSRINRATTFLPDEFVKRPQREKDSIIKRSKNPGVTKLKTIRDIESARIGEKRGRDRNEGEFRRRTELAENGTMNKLICTDDGSETSETTFPNCSSSEENQSRNVEAVANIAAGSTITSDSPCERSAPAARTTLIFNSKILNANGKVVEKENAISPYKSAGDEHSKSYQTDEFPTAEIYERDKYSKVGFANVNANMNRKGDEDFVNSFTSHAPNPLDNHLAGKKLSHAERPLLWERKRALRTTRDTSGLRREYRSLMNSIALGMKRKVAKFDKSQAPEKGEMMAVNYGTRDLLPTNLSVKRIDESMLYYPTSARISVTQERNPMNVRHVRSGVDCERPQTNDLEAGVRGRFRIGLRNVSDPLWIAKFRSSLDQKARSRSKYSRKHRAVDIILWPRVFETIDGESEVVGRPREISTGSKFAALGVANVSDNSGEMREINGRAQSLSEPADEPGLKSVGVAVHRGGSNQDARKGCGFYSQRSGIHNSEYRRYKRHQVSNTPEISSELGGETRMTSDATRATTSNSFIEFTAKPSAPTTETSNADQVPSDAKEPPTTTEAPSSSEYREIPKEWRSITPIITDREEYASTPSPDNSVSLEIPLIKAPPRTLNSSSTETPAFLIGTVDRSTAITKVDKFIIPKEAPSVAGVTDVQVSHTTNGDGFDVAPSIEPINSRAGYGVYGNESVSTIDPLAQRNSDPARGVFENITTEYVVGSSTTDDALKDQWPVKHSAVVEGDLVLGGLMMVHEREDTYTCGPVMPQGGVQALEAMLYTLDTLNERGIVPGVKIGAHILDDCDKDTYGLEMAVDFIKGSISNIDGAEYHCNKTVRKVISGVVGAASSVTSIQVANLLRLFRIPQVSFFSTSPELSNKQRFEYFTRTIPSDHYQVKVMVDIVLSMNWSYVSIIYEESNYGIKAFEELEELLGKHNICIAVKEKLVKDSGVAEEIAYDNIVSKLLTKPRARGCIIFGSDQEVAGVMRAVRRCNATGAFSWIGSDGWSARGLVSDGNEPEVEGTLSVQPQANPVKGFEEYFLNLTVENNRRNPWFVEFWEHHFECRYPNSSRTPYNKKFNKTCTTKERLTKEDTAFEDQLQFVSDAVMAFAYAFRDMHRDVCRGKEGLCDAMKPTQGTTLLQYLRKVNFEGLSGDKFRFDKNGDGPARYNIIHFKQTEPGKYKWIRVGKYLEGELRLNMTEIQFKLGHPQSPESVCSLPCELGQAKKYVEGERCCWHCFNCTQYQIRHTLDETQCTQCRRGTLPDETHSACRDIPEEFLHPFSSWAIGAMLFSAFGIMVTLSVCIVFLKHNDTPVVRASGRELSYVLLSGILLCYLVTFTLVLKPTDIVCGIQRFSAGFCFTVVYAALLTKTNRISRIFNAGSAKRPSFISPRSQLIICFGLVFVQILINGVWMIIDPARAMHHYPTMEDNLLVCNNYIDASYMIAFAYPTILIVVCTIYAILTRKIPEAFNESKHIGLTMYTTCVIWCAFVPLYYGTGSNVALRITSMSVTISLSASVTVACLFTPKLYIILIRPERNVRPTVRAGRPNQTKSSAITATNASSMMGPVTATTVLTAATCDQNKAIKKHIASTIDCSTQSEWYELEIKDQKKNGEPPVTRTSRATQTTNVWDNEKEFVAVVTNNKESPDVIASASNKESKNSTTTAKRLNSNARIGNGPLSQSDVSL
ncbi:uncharacterized protein [Linepithema humile]|uniref:uncharacterized protein isoform X1 n=1 Tax=Linepithema humile TaxID=83485 RepID=UPI00351E8682